MPIEIVIIICLGAALYLLLRHYPQVKSGDGLRVEKFKHIFRQFPALNRRKKVAESEILELVAKENREIVAPAEIESAGVEYRERDPDLARLLFQANEAFLVNDLRVAEDLSLDVIAKNKRSSYAYVIAGKVAFTRGQFSDAREAFKMAIKCNRESAEAYYWSGLIEEREDNMSGAIDHLQKSINLEKGHAEWYAELGRAYMQVRQYAKAAKVLKRAASLDIDNKEYKELASEAEDKQKSHSFYTRMN